MARLMPDRQELDATLVIYGGSRAGKTTVLHCINDRVAPERHGTVTPLGAGLVEAPLLDWLPLELGVIGGWRTRVHLYAVPGQPHADTTRRMLLARTDAVLFVADSQAQRLPETQAAADALRENLRTETGEPRQVPMVVLLTKRDLPDELLLDVETLREALAFGDAPAFACAARRGTGVLEGLHAAVMLMMRHLALPRPAAS
jgi:mutual gliding-motility protein MglA